MIIGLGIDVVDLERFAQSLERYGERLQKRMYTDVEQEYCERFSSSLEHYAARFAAKEAVAKALGTGIGPINWKEIEILRGTAGKPELYLNGQAEVIAGQLGLNKWSISLSHSQTYAVAMAVAITQ